MQPIGNTPNCNNEMQDLSNKHILISRTDGIGDVILTLPLAGELKRLFPSCTISFLGRTYTQDVVSCCEHVDRFLNWDTVAEGSLNDQVSLFRRSKADVIFHVFPRKQVVIAAAAAKIPMRIGTARRVHAFTRMTHKLWYSRKDAGQHEAVLNLRMLEGLKSTNEYAEEQIPSLYGFKTKPIMNGAALELLQQSFKIILHPMSHGSAVEWGLANYAKLIEALEGKGVSIGITGTEKERNAIGNALPWDKVIDLGGKLTLSQLVSTIGASNGLVAASTGPLHIAAAAGIHALGLYSPKKPLFPTRWKPLGDKAEYLVARAHPEDGILEIQVEEVAERILEWKANF